MSGAVNVLGVDLSLTRSGIALPDGTVCVLRPPYGPKQPEQRLEWIRRQIVNAARGDTEAPHADLVCMEGFSFGSKGSALDQIHGLGWIVRMALRDADIAYAVPSPSSLKKYALGKGGGPGTDKLAMVGAAAKRLGYTTDKPDDNEADALWLRAMAMDAYGCPVVKVPEAHREALGKVAWPELGRAAA